MTEKKGVRLQGRPRYEPPRVVRLGAAADGRGQGCYAGSGDGVSCNIGNSASGDGCVTGNSAGGVGCALGNSPV